MCYFCNLQRCYYIDGSKGAPGTPPGSKFFHFYAVFGKKFSKQECIPVGCVTSAAVAICPGGCLPKYMLGCLPGGFLPQCMVGYVCPWGCLPQCMVGYVCPGGCLPQCMLGYSHLSPWIEWLTGVKTLPCRNYVADGNNRLATHFGSWRPSENPGSATG